MREACAMVELGASPYARGVSAHEPPLLLVALCPAARAAPDGGLLLVCTACDVACAAALAAIAARLLRGEEALGGEAAVMASEAVTRALVVAPVPGDHAGAASWLPGAVAAV